MGIKSLYKKNNNIKKSKIISIGIVLFILLLLTCICIHKENVKKQKAIDEQIAKENAAIEAITKEKAVKNAIKYDYDIQFTDAKTFCIEKDDVKYYFFIEASKVVFDNCEFLVETNEIVKKGNMEITITDLHDGNIKAFYDDSRVVILDDGAEEGQYSTGYFISNSEFDEESLTAPDTLIDGDHKVKKAYDKIMCLTTIENLKEHYNQALAICNQLNE